MSDLNQKSIEQYFNDFNIKDPDQKAKMLPEVTNIIYDRNMLVVDYEKENDEYKKKQIANDLEELDQKIEKIFQNFKK